MMPARAHHTGGFALIELLVVSVILGALALIGAAGFRNVVEQGRLESATHGLYTALTDARSAALAAEHGAPYGVQIEPERVVLFRGGEYDPLDPRNRSVEFSGITATAALDDGSSAVVFEKRTGRTAGSGTITLLQEATQASTTLTVHPSGVVSAE